MQHTTRRQFVTLAGSAALGTVGGTIVTAKPKDEPDFVLQHLDHEIVRLGRKAQHGKATDGDISVVSAYLRLLAEHPTIATANVRHVTLSDLAQIDLEAKRRELERHFGVQLNQLMLPDVAVQQQILDAMHKSVPQALRDLATMIDHRPKDAHILPANFIGQDDYVLRRVQMSPW